LHDSRNCRGREDRKAHYSEAAAKGEAVRALIHAKQSADLKELGAKELVIGDMMDPATLRKATAGVRAVVHVGPGFNPKERTWESRQSDAAAEAKVERFVYISVIHPMIGALINHRAKLPVEEHLIDSDLNYTILQPMHYMQNIRVNDTIEQGVLWQTVDLDRPLSTLTSRTSRDAAVKVLNRGRAFRRDLRAVRIGPPHGPRTGENHDDISGRKIEPRLVPIDSFLSSRQMAGLDDYGKDGLRRLFTYYSRRGIFGNPNVMTWLLGRGPTSFAEFVRREMDRES